MQESDVFESKEMYLETILGLSFEKKQVRAKDIALKMQFSKASVSRAIGILLKENLISRDEKDNITLTDKGSLIAEKIFTRHRFLSEFFIFIGVDKDIAEKDACKIEHVISDETFYKMQDFFKSLSSK